MLHYIALFVVMAVVAAMIGFTDRNADAMEIAKVLFVIFHLLFAGALLMRSHLTSDAPQK
jgi:uncharacterized membrane protein YtjA (UPF0391 family)